MESGKTIVKLFNPKKISMIPAATILFSGVYLRIVLTDKGCFDFFTITVSMIHIRVIAIIGINFFLFFISNLHQ